MVERAQVRCPVCRSVVPAMLLWAVGDACPRCQWGLDAGGRQPDTPGLHAERADGRGSRASATIGRSGQAVRQPAT